MIFWQDVFLSKCRRTLQQAVYMQQDNALELTMNADGKDEERRWEFVFNKLCLEHLDDLTPNSTARHYCPAQH